MDSARFPSSCERCTWMGDEYAMLEGKLEPMSFHCHVYEGECSDVITWECSQSKHEMSVADIETNLGYRVGSKQDAQEIGLALYYDGSRWEHRIRGENEGKDSPF